MKTQTEMNEIEETLLMLFLEEENLLDLYVKLHGNNALTILEYDKLDLSADKWNDFKKEELGRTLPETFDLFISKEALGWLREGESIGISIANRKYYNTPIKIKITVVGE